MKEPARLDIPRAVRSQLPELSALNDQQFEDLCCSLMEKQEGISYALKHESKGVADQGVDVIGYRADGRTWVMQCKCVGKFGPAEIKAASEEFFKHWQSKWKSYEIDRFVLVVTCDVKSSKGHEQLREEAERFRSHQIEYEPWFLTRLIDKLEPHRSLVARYYEMSTVEWICGTPQAVPYSAKVQISSLTQALEESVERLADAESARLRELKRRWHLGQAQDVYNQVETILGQLDLLPQDVQRDYLRFAVHVISSQNLGRAMVILQQLASLAPDAAQATRAILELNQGHFDLALESIADNDSIDAVSVRSLVLLHREQNDEAVALLEALHQPSIETDRILALSYLVTGRLDAAEALLRQRLSEEPTRESLRLALTKVLFYQALSPVSWPSSLWKFLAPVEPALVKSQPDDLAKAEEALRILHDIVDSSQNSQSVQEAKQWLFASLCLFQTELSENATQKLFDEEMDQAEPDSLIVNWAITYLEDLDIEATETRLRVLAGADHSNLQYTVALVNLQLRQGEPNKACALLEEQLVRLEGGSGQSQLKTWLARAYLAAGRRDEAVTLVKGSQDIAEFLLFPEDEASSVEKAAATLYERYQRNGNLEALLGAARLKSNLRDWPWLAQIGTQLIKEIQTSEALSIATAAAFNAGNYRLCLELLEQAGTLSSEFLPRKVYALLELGRLKEAGDAVCQFAATDCSIEALRCQLFYYHASGRNDEILNLSKRFLASAEATGSDFFRLAFSMRTVDRGQARLLLERALKLGIEDDLVIGALQLTSELGSTDDRYLKPLIERMALLADEGRSDIQKVSVEDIRTVLTSRKERERELFENFSHGIGPAHGVCEIAGLPLSWQYLMWPTDNRRRNDARSSPPVFFRSARRVHSSRFPEDTRLNIDITALFTLEDLGLVGRLADWFSEIRVPAVLLRALSFDLERLLARRPTDFAEGEQIASERQKRHFDRVKSLKAHLELLLADPCSRWTTLDVEALPTLDPDEPEGPYLRCILELLVFTPDVRDVILVDDRFVTRTEYREGNVPLATTYDFLSYLKQKNTLSDTEYLAAIHSLRASNYRYVPVDDWELNQRLSEATLDGQDLEPTEYLDILRTSIAASLYSAEYLEPPSGNDQGEWTYLLRLTRAVSKALVACFKPGLGLERSYAQAYWLMENLYLDLTGLRECVGADNRQSLTERAAITYASLLSTVFLVLRGHTEELQEARKRCLQWIYGAVVYPVEADGELLHATCLAFTDMFAGPLLRDHEGFEPDSEFTDVYRMTLSSDYMELPDVIKEHLLELDRFVEALHLPVGSQITVDEHGFESRTFLEGLQKVVAEGSAEIEDVSGFSVKIEIQDDGIVLTQGNSRVNVSSELVYPFTANTPTEIIEQLYPWFDCPPEEPLQQLSQADSPLERAKITLQWKSESPEHKYQRLVQELDSASAHSADLLFPVGLSRLLSRYHLNDELDFVEATESLVKLSVKLAFERLSVFPLALPSSLIAAYAGLTEEERDTFLSDIETATPLQRFHLAHLLGVTGSDWEAVNRLLEPLQTESGKGEIEAFLSLLEWSLEHFAKRRDARLNPTTCLLLAWAHAEELFKCFCRAGINITELSSRFQSFKRPLAPIAARLRANSEVTKDVTYLSIRHRETLLLAGLLYATADQQLSSHWVSVINSLVLLGPNRDVIPTFVEDIWKSDLLGSWLSRRFYEKRLNAILSIDKPIDVSRAELEKQLHLRVASLEDTPQGSAHSLLFFAYLANQGDCPDWFSEAFARVYEKYGLKALVTEPKSQRDGQTQIVALAILIGSTPEVTQNAFWGHFLEVLRTSSECDLEMTSLVYESILALEGSAHRDSRRIRRVGERFETILKVAPTLSTNLKVWLTALLFELGPEEGFPLWKAVILARAVPARAGRD